MAYQIEPAKPLGGEIARIARELLHDGMQGLGAKGSGKERIHHARTTCKKVRALLRLLRDRHRGFVRRENRRLRDASDLLASFRDAEVMLAAAQTLRPAGRDVRPALQALQRHLTAHRQSVLADRKGIAERLVVFRRELHASQAAMKTWQPKERGFAAMELEIEATYRRARRLGRRLDGAAPGAEYHEWRKAVKAFGYQCRFLRGAWPEVAKSYSREVDQLSELLGTEHDLTILKEFVTRDGGKSRPPARRGHPLLRLIECHRLELRRQAHAAAERIFAEKPRAYVARVRRWWAFAARTSGGGKPAPDS
jgi:CHAD domain-containing protein